MFRKKSPPLPHIDPVVGPSELQRPLEDLDSTSTAGGDKKPERMKKAKVPKAAKRERPGKPPRTRKMDYEILTHPARLQYVTHRKLLLCGHSLFATLDAHRSPGDGFVEQPPRASAPSLRMLLGGKHVPLRVSVDERLLQRPKTRYALALDGYLAWGKRHGSDCTILIGGGEEDTGSFLEIYVFQDRVLIDVLERELPNSSQPSFPISLDTLIDDLATRYPKPRFVAAAPLPRWTHSRVHYLGDSPIRSLTFLPLSAKTRAMGARPLVLTAGAGLLVYTGLLLFGWHAYSKAVADYKREAEDPALAAAGGMDNAHLDVMQQRRNFMMAGRPQIELAKRSKAIVAGIASIPGLQIAQVTFHGALSVDASPAPAQSATAATPAPDVSMELIVPVRGATSVEQAQSLMRLIGNRTGLTLRLVPGGWSEDAGSRTLRIEGFL